MCIDVRDRYSDFQVFAKHHALFTCQMTKKLGDCVFSVDEKTFMKKSNVMGNLSRRK